MGMLPPFPVDVISIAQSVLTWALTHGKKETAKGKIWEAIFSNKFRH